MGTSNSKKQKQNKPDLSATIKNAENKLLISWTTSITKQWFEYHLTTTSSTKSLLQAYINKLCVTYGFDGHGLSLMNTAFFIKISSNIIEEESKILNSSTDEISKAKQLIDSFYDDHIVRIQSNFNERFPSIEPTKHTDRNIDYLEQIKDEPSKILKWYHYQSEYRLGYQSRSDQRVWILQPSVCKRHYGKIELVRLHKFESIKKLKTKNSSDPLSKSILFSRNNESKALSLTSISCFIWYSLTLSSRKDTFHNFAMPKGAYSKRVNASSGGLHPTEAYFILPPKTLKNTHKQWQFCHYAVSQHALEILGTFNRQNEEKHNDDEEEHNVFYVLLSAVSYREVWKYGERGLRYCLLDNGHALSALVIVCNLMGWQCQISPSNITFNDLQNRFNLPSAEYPRILLKIKCFESDNINCREDFDVMNADKWILHKNEYITETYCELGEIWPILGYVQNYCFSIDDGVDGSNPTAASLGKQTL